MNNYLVSVRFCRFDALKYNIIIVIIIIIIIINSMSYGKVLFLLANDCVVVFARNFQWKH